jgi:hypothetical protein
MNRLTTNEAGPRAKMLLSMIQSNTPGASRPPFARFFGQEIDGDESPD